MATGSPPSDWQVGKTLTESLDYLLTSGLAWDVTFIVGVERSRINAHKLILISRSPVFFAMLMGPLPEKGEITIPNISPTTFNLLLRYLYTDNIHLTDENVVPVYKAARQYCVDSLVSLCDKDLRENLTVDCVCTRLEQSHNSFMENLEKDCLRFILEHPFAILQSVTFTELCLDCVTIITRSDCLSIRERVVYEALVSWAESECVRQNIEATPESKRLVLGEALYTVRFIHIDDGFLFDRICADKILNPDDLHDIINHKTNKTALKSEKLNTKRRSYNQRKYCRNGPVKNEQWSNPPVDEAISFKSSADLYMFGFGSFFTTVGQSSVDLKLLEDDVCLVQATKPREQPKPDTPYMGDVLLDTPIKIHAGKTYTILELSKDKVIHYFTGGITQATYQDITIEFINSSRSSRTNIHWGQIPYLILSV